MLLNGLGLNMFTDTTSYRPRNGQSAEAYWRVRLWLAENDFSFSDLINALMIPVAFHLTNHSEVFPDKGYAMVDLTMGSIPIIHIMNGKQYPLRNKVDKSKDHLTIENIKERIAHWEARNEDTENEVDKFLKNVVHTS